ncbi:MAG TPA: formate dehydrogenase accessory sulfurtransferase FdhD [Longimicrobiales bacterium]|nr:formate dehydrogenase accessory sulfurtransferase FdhD [Longimicrobiales bacterium]
MIGQKGAIRAVRVARSRGSDTQRVRDDLAVEEPLEIRVSWTGRDGRAKVEPLAVTMRTPGDDFDLVAGFLVGEGVVSTLEDLVEMTYCRGGEAQEYNTVEARLGAGAGFDPDRLRRNFYTTSSCGVCGKASLEAVEAQGCRVLPDGLRIGAELLPELPERLRAGQTVFERTGGLHAAGLFDTEGERRIVREDVGRHNAVDKVLGRAFLDRMLPARGLVMVVSGRASFELVQKAVMGGVSVLVAVGAPSSLAVDLAQRFNQTLVGFARGDGFNVYSGGERIR